MKTLIFMRHGFLEGKYSDYSKLGFTDFEDLLTKKVSPHIDKSRTRACLSGKEFLKKMDIVICSTEGRSIETAKLVQELTHIDFRKSPMLDEIGFENGVISKEDVDIHDFGHLRKKILTSFFNSKHSEDFEHTQERIIQFLEYANGLGNEYILCITHGWLMRLIYIYSKKGSLEDISLNELLDTKVPDFLDTIEVYMVK